MPKVWKRFWLSLSQWGGFSDVSIANLQASINVASFSTVICLWLNFTYRSIWNSSHKNSSTQILRGQKRDRALLFGLSAGFSFLQFPCVSKVLRRLRSLSAYQNKKKKTKKQTNQIGREEKWTKRTSNPTRSEMKLQNHREQSQSSQSKGMWRCTQALELHCALWAQQHDS